MPELLKRPAVSVRLVAGERTQDPGVRVAEMCGLPRTLDLAGLTREIFGLALVSERSSRRTQLEFSHGVCPICKAKVLEGIGR